MTADYNGYWESISLAEDQAQLDDVEEDETVPSSLFLEKALYYIANPIAVDYEPTLGVKEVLAAGFLYLGSLVQNYIDATNR